MLKKIAIFIIFGLMIVAALWQFQILKFQSSEIEKTIKPSKTSVPLVKVITQPVAFTPNNRVFEAVGTGRAKYSADIYPAVSEEVINVYFKAQQNVNKGDVLVQLDNREQKLTLKLAGVELKEAKTTLDRFEKIFKQGAVPQNKVDSARAIFESSQVALDQAKLAVEARQIIAPFDGIVGIPNVDPGDRIDTNTMITGLDARDTLYVDFEVPEALIAALEDAQTKKQVIMITTPSYPVKIFEGLITAQASRVNESRRTLMARASILNTDDALRPGMSFTTKWDIPGKDFATVPEISVQWGRNGSFIWIIRNNKAEKVKARVVARKAGQVLLDAVVQKGDQVVVEGLQRLRPSTKVLILNMTEETVKTQEQAK